jgi:hypothetical protein
VTRAESRAREEYPPMERNPIVPSMASMVITTMSSTRVKPWNLGLDLDLGVEVGVFVLGVSRCSSRLFLVCFMGEVGSGSGVG